MRASEALKAPGDAARRESDGAVLYWTYDNATELPIMLDLKADDLGESYEWLSDYELEGTPGDDWQPLQTPLQRVSAASLLGYKHGVANAESDAAAKITELEADIANAVREAKRRDPDYPFTEDTASEAVWALGESLRGTEAANKDCHDRLAELEAQVAQERQWRVDAQELADKREEDNAALSAEVERLGEQANLYRQSIGNNFNQLAKQDATIADLTAKLAAVEKSFNESQESLAACMDGSAFVGAETTWGEIPFGHFYWQQLYGQDRVNLLVKGHRDQKLMPQKVFAYTGPATAPLPKLEQPAPTKPKCLDGVPAVLCRDEEDKEWWCHGTVSNGQVLMFRWYGGKSSWTAGFVAELTPIHHAPDAAGLAEEIREGGE